MTLLVNCIAAAAAAAPALLLQTLSIAGFLWLAYASVGVIYGDIGTSPLYVYSTIFQEPPEREDVLCAASLVFWSITLVVLVKYVFIVMLADDNGEG